MGARRFDVVQIYERWLLTDSGALMLWFPTLKEGLIEGKRLAAARELPTVLHLWRDGVPIEVYRNQAAEIDDRA